MKKILLKLGRGASHGVVVDAPLDAVSFEFKDGINRFVVVGVKY